MYLGAAALVGMLSAFALRRWREMVPAFAILFAAWIVIDDPGRWIARLSLYAPIINESLRQWNFTGALTLAAAYLAACGIAAQWGKLQLAKGFSLLAVFLAALWTARFWFLYSNGGIAFGQGWWSAGEVAITATLAFLLLRASHHRVATIALLALILTEYKVYGTSRRFNSSPGKVDQELAVDKRTGGREFQGVEPRIYGQMLHNADYRVVANEGLPATDFRYYGLSSPQGFDPFLTQAYRQKIETYVPFATNRTFLIDWNNTAMLHDLGIRYALAPPNSKTREQLKDHARFRKLGQDDSYFQVFEYLDAKPAWRFPAGPAQRFAWLPEWRIFRVQSEAGGEFELLEQWFPGWKAFIDEKPVEIKRTHDVFQSIQIPPGTHAVEFRFRSESLRFGAIVSVLSLLALFPILWRGSSP
jgi:hypothetical protein